MSIRRFIELGDIPIITVSETGRSALRVIKLRNKHGLGAKIIVVTLSSRQDLRPREKIPIGLGDLTSRHSY